jgi:hypothetical protein
VSSSNYFCSQGKLIGSEAATLFIPHRWQQCHPTSKTQQALKIDIL